MIAFIAFDRVIILPIMVGVHLFGKGADFRGHVEGTESKALSKSTTV